MPHLSGHTQPYANANAGLGLRHQTPPPALSLPTPGASFPVYGQIPDLNPLTAAANPQMAQNFANFDYTPSYNIGGSGIFGTYSPPPTPQGGTPPFAMTDGQFADDSTDYNTYADDAEANPAGYDYLYPGGVPEAGLLGMSDPNPETIPYVKTGGGAGSVGDQESGFLKRTWDRKKDDFEDSMGGRLIRLMTGGLLGTN